MAMCPMCKTEQTKRVAGLCPNCKEPISIYKGVWYRDTGSSPTVTILEFLENSVSKNLTAESGKPVVFKINKKSPTYKRELVTAELLLSDADHDINKVIRAIALLFSDKKFNWKLRTSLVQVRFDFPLALAIVTSIMDAEEEEYLKQQKQLNKIMRKEDVFS